MSGGYYYDLSLPLIDGHQSIHRNGPKQELNSLNYTKLPMSLHLITRGGWFWVCSPAVCVTLLTAESELVIIIPHVILFAEHWQRHGIPPTHDEEAGT